jgi:hypothetical protein
VSGDRVSWFLVERGWKVVAADGKPVGSVEEIVGDTGQDIFSGLSVSPGLLKRPRYVPAEAVEEITEGEIRLKLSSEEFERLGAADERGDPAARPKRLRSDAEGRHAGLTPGRDRSGQSPSHGSKHLADRLPELRGQPLRVRFVPRDHQARVVSGQRADDVLVVEAVESARDRRRRPELGVQDDDVARGRGPPAELAQDSDQRGVGIGRPAAVGERVARPSERIVCLLEPERADVPRDGRLRDAAPGAFERRQQLELRPDSPARDDARDQPLPFSPLHEQGIVIRCFDPPQPGYDVGVLRKLLWSGLYAGFAAAATMAARRAASRVWRLATGEEPPAKK